MSTNASLWEQDHPYYCSTGDTSNEFRHQSWEGFLEEWGKADKDYNCLFRWDISEFEEDDEWNPGNEDGETYFQLQLSYILQRKGKVVVVYVAVKKSETLLIWEFLTDHWQHMLKLWQPFGQPPIS